MNRVLVGRVLPWMLLAPTCWVAYRLFLQKGQLLLRVEDLEQKLQQLDAAHTSGGRLRLGLPVGSVLHDFDLPDLLGGRMTLSQWRGRRVLLIFFDPHCRFSRALLPHLAALSPDPSDGRPVPLILSTGDAQENRDLFLAHGIRLPVLLQEDREVASLYRVGGTPAGCLVDERRHTANRLAVGTQSLLALVGAVMDDVGHDVSVDDGDYTPHHGTNPPGGSRLNCSGLARGTAAPSFCFPRLDGGQLCLEEYRGRRVLLVFSDPACEPCDELAPALERLQRSSPDLQLLMVSRGDPEANRQKVSEHGLTFPVVLQRHWEISREYGMVATPIGYLIDEQGVIAADVAVGQKAILALVSGLPAQRKRAEALWLSSWAARRPGPSGGHVARSAVDSRAPFVSVVLTTRDRPRLLSIALACYKHQTYPKRELIVVDDGAIFPADTRAVAAVGGTLIRTEPGTPLGTKLNRGLSEARGPICQKMDDDDWYAPRFLETMVSAFRDNARVVCRPTLAFLMPFLFFDVARWEVRQSVDKNAPGATLLFSRDDWKERPFRALPGDEDVWFFLDQTRFGVSALAVLALEMFLAVRHAGSRQDRGHTWTHQGNGLVLEEYLKHRPVYKRGPEALLPDWALEIYRDLRRDLIATPAVGTVPASLD